MRWPVAARNAHVDFTNGKMLSLLSFRFHRIHAPFWGAVAWLHQGNVSRPLHERFESLHFGIF
jgi:hypothetical protein